MILDLLHGPNGFYTVNPPHDWWVHQDLKAPFPWFGGKSKIASMAWERFGEVKNYVEPFYATGAVLLGRPHAPVIETGNDIDGFVVNFWRAVQWAPDEVAKHCDWPVFELDLHARHKWLVARREKLKARLLEDPLFYDARIAGWWVWGLCAWIGSGWCTGNGESTQVPRIGGNNASGDGKKSDHGHGVHSKSMRLPHLGAGTGGEDDHACAHYGKGVHGKTAREQLPDLAPGHSPDDTRTGQGINSKVQRSRLIEIMRALAHRLRYVRFTCGDAMRVLSDAVTWRHGLTGILIDPPYPPDSGCEKNLYAGGKGNEREVFDRVFRYCIENGHRKDLRIGFCYYEGTTGPVRMMDGTNAPADVSTHLRSLGWEIVPWKSRGGYGGQSGTNENAARERIAFSPHCLRAAQRSLFE